MFEKLRIFANTLRKVIPFQTNNKKELLTRKPETHSTINTFHNNFLLFLETRFCCVARTGLELRASSSSLPSC